VPKAKSNQSKVYMSASEKCMSPLEDADIHSFCCALSLISWINLPNWKSGCQHLL